MHVPILRVGDACATMRTGVKKGFNCTVFLPNHDDGVDSQLGRQVITGLRHLVRHAADIPDGVPHLLVLALQIVSAGVAIAAYGVAAQLRLGLFRRPAQSTFKDHGVCCVHYFSS